MPEKSITLSTELRLQVPAADVWEFLADTDRLNKSVNLPVIDFTPRDHERGYYDAEARYYGITFRYQEFPFDFVREQHYEVLRRFRLGVVRDVRAGMRMKPEGNHTLLEIYALIEPRNIVSIAAARLVLQKQAINDIVRLTRRFEQEYIQKRTPSAVPAEMRSAVNASQLLVREKRLSNGLMDRSAALQPVIDKLRRHIEHGSNIETSSMRPFTLADRWNAARYDVLTVFLHAAHAGLLNLHWVVLCPNCNAASTETATLAEVRRMHHCDTCQIRYDADLAGSVEARFSVHSAIRAGRKEIYCIGGPANMPQVIAQLRIPPSSSRTVTIPLHRGIVRVRSYATPNVETLRITGGSEESGQITIRIAGERIAVNSETTQAGQTRFLVENKLDTEALIVIEQESWRETAATAALVTSLQEFKDLFPHDAVALGEELVIGSLTILFTDLKGSTTLYKTIGDSRAFAFVQNHFRFLTEHIAAHHGGVYKTMGDAVMASFASGADALAAALEMQTHWAEFVAKYGNGLDVQLKVGIHDGPAIAINNRGRLDCFGSSVNIASHLQKASAGGDIVISEAVYCDAEVREVLRRVEGRVSVQPFGATLKGYGEMAYPAHRIVVNG